VFQTLNDHLHAATAGTFFMVRTVSPDRIMKFPGERSRKKMLRPHLALIGEIAYSWNVMHERLADVFWIVAGIQDGRIAHSIWHSSASDLAQRKMLSAALFIRFDEHSAEYKVVSWLLTEINKISINRNSAIHAPLAIVGGFTWFDVLPKPDSKSPHAQRLEGKKLLNEFTLYRDRINALREFTYSVYIGLTFPDNFPLPQIPRSLDALIKDRAGRRPLSRSKQSRSTPSSKVKP
jgi:hypothetical protein